MLVIDSQGLPDSAVFGEITTAEAVRKGLAGVVTDGYVRDIDGIRQMNFPIFPRGTSPKVAGRSGPGEVNVPVQCGGVVVHPGDVVVGDADGVVVVPRVKAAEILKIAAGIIEFEASLLEKVCGGLSQVEYFGLDVHMRPARSDSTKLR